MKTTADIVIEVLNRFGGFDHWWHEIDPSDKGNIKKALNTAINNFSGMSPGKLETKTKLTDHE